jgi:hypothetical protein
VKVLDIFSGGSNQSLVLLFLPYIELHVQGKVPFLINDQRISHVNKPSTV